jgi:hypothetical protein
MRSRASVWWILSSGDLTRAYRHPGFDSQGCDVDPPPRWRTPFTHLEALLRATHSVRDLASTDRAITRWSDYYGIAQMIHPLPSLRSSYPHARDVIDESQLRQSSSDKYTSVGAESAS